MNSLRFSFYASLITVLILIIHVGRHSFATIVRGGGVPTGVISEMLGHTTEKMTHNYLASFDRSYFDRAYGIITAVLSGSVAV